MRVKHVYLMLNWSCDRILRGIARFAQNKKWVLQMSRSHQPWWPDERIYDGILSIIPRNSSLAGHAARASIPVVDLANAERTISLHRVVPDSQSIGHEAAEYFVAKGFKSFATFNFADSWVEEERHEAFEESLKVSGFQCRKFCYPKPNEYHQGHEAVKNWAKAKLSALPAPTAVFVGNDIFALLVIECCVEQEILIPDQVALLGVDNDPISCEYAIYPLSSLDSDLESVGYNGAGVLHRLMAGERVGEKIQYVPPKGVVSRRSTDILASDSPAIRKALRFINEHYKSPISVDDVVSASGSSRTRLYREFDDELQCSISKMIMRLRIREVKRCLLETNAKVQHIAEDCGFEEQSSLCRAFKRETGMTLNQFKSAHSGSDT